MNGREILEALSFIDDELLAASEAPVRKAPRGRWAALAACLCILVLGAYSFISTGRDSATEGMAEYYAADNAMAMGTPEAAREDPEEDGAADTDAPAGNGRNETAEVTAEAAATAKVEVLELTEEGFTARIIEISYPFTGEETVTVILMAEPQAELTVGGEYTIHIESFDEWTGTFLVFAVE